MCPARVAHRHLEVAADAVQHHIFASQNRAFPHLREIGCRPGFVQVQPVQLAEGIAVDRERIWSTIDRALYPMLVDPPLRKARKMLDDALAVRMEGTRAVAVYEQTFGVMLVIGIAAEVGSTADDSRPLPGVRQHANYNTAGEAQILRI